MKFCRQVLFSLVIASYNDQTIEVFGVVSLRSPNVLKRHDMNAENWRYESQLSKHSGDSPLDEAPAATARKTPHLPK